MRVDRKVYQLSFFIWACPAALKFKSKHIIITKSQVDITLYITAAGRAVTSIPRSQEQNHTKQ